MKGQVTRYLIIFAFTAYIMLSMSHKRVDRMIHDETENIGDRIKTKYDKS